MKQLSMKFPYIVLLLFEQCIRSFALQIDPFFLLVLKKPFDWE